MSRSLLNDTKQHRLPKALIWIAAALIALAVAIPVISGKARLGRTLCMAFASIDATNCMLLDNAALIRSNDRKP